jgi:hypothetical protein
MHNLPYNGRKPLVRFAAMKQIARFAAIFAASLTLAGAAFAQSPVYKVKDLTLDKVAPSAAEAQLQARNDAKVVAAQRLIDRLTLPEDRANARQALDAAAIARLTRSSTSQGEKTSAVPGGGGFRATGFVTWSFRDDEVRKYLEGGGVPYVDSQAALAMIVPVAVGIDPGQWGAAWMTQNAAGQSVARSDETVLTPYIASTESWNRRPSWADIQEELTSVRADRGVIAEVFQQGAQYYVRLIDMRANIPDPNIGQAGPFVSLQSAQAGAIAELERAWKVSSIVRSSGATDMAVTANFADLQEWVRIKKGLESSRLVRDLNIEALSVAGADVSFNFSGRPDQLATDLRSRGVDLQGGNGAWTLRVYTAQ